MKYLVFLLLSLSLFSCSSKPVGVHSNDLDLPKPPPIQNTQSQRKLASDEEYLSVSYDSFFKDHNYVGRLQQVRKLVRQLHFLMEEKGHPRKRLLKKFQDDLDTQIALLERIEVDQEKVCQGKVLKSTPLNCISTNSWLPQKDSYQYSAKLRALQAVKNSGDVMAQLEVYLASTKVLEDDTYDQNFYNNLMKKALKVLGDELQAKTNKSAEEEKELLQAQQLSYGAYLASSARGHLHKVFPDPKKRSTEKQLSNIFKRLQRVRIAKEAKNLVTSPDFGVDEALSILANADYTSSSDIEGFRDDVDTKLSTYFGLEMIKYLYSQMN